MNSYLELLKLRNFRNCENISISFSKRINVITGGNAQGKTNILEGIYFLSVARSHRTNQDDELIQHGKTWFYIKGEVSSSGSATTIEIINSKDNGKKLKIDGKVQDKVSNILGRVNVVIFSPEDMLLINGAGVERRRFIDMLIARADRSYLHLLQDYRKALKQRNSLLKKIGQGSGASILSLEPWDELITQSGSEIMLRRSSYVKELSEVTASVHKKLVGYEEDVGIEYSKAIETGDDLQELKERYSRELTKLLRRDIARGSTSFGPHHEDLMLKINNMDARRYGSRGQQRTLALALKIASLEIFNAKTGRYPIMLLDDLTSELDRKRIRCLVDMLSGMQIQIFITVVNSDLDSLMTAFKDTGDCNIITVENGRIKDKI